MTRFGLLILTMLLALLPTTRTAAEPTNPTSPPTYYRLVLDQAMYREGDPNDPRELVLDLVQYGDDWGTVYGVSRNYNMPFHKGAVHKASMKGDRITLEIGTVITPDKWISGGQGQYTLEMKRSGERALVGTFEGEYKGKKVAGTVKGEAYRPAYFEGYRPSRHRNIRGFCFASMTCPNSVAKQRRPSARPRWRR